MNEFLFQSALAFVKRKYVARENRGILYVEAAQDDLAKEIASFALEEFNRGVAGASQAIRDWQAVAEAAKARGKSLEAALKNYGQHKITCDALGLNWNKGPCDCGFDDARATLKLKLKPQS